jgi:galactose mutarotase-like enzyme
MDVSKNQSLTLQLEPTLGGSASRFYTPSGEDYFCLEPQTHCVNAFNSLEVPPVGSGIKYLESGQDLSLDVAVMIKE